MKMYDVIVERDNGHYRAVFPTLPNVSAEGATRDEAIAAATTAANRYLREVEITTVHLDSRKQQEPGYRPAIEREFAMAAEANSPDAEMRRGSLESVLRAAADCRIDMTTEIYKEYEADLAAEKQRQREEAEREADETQG